MEFVSAEEIHSALSYPTLIDALRVAFASNKIITPQRHHHQFGNPTASLDSTLLLMPSWIEGDVLGVKMVIVSPENGKHNLPAIQGQYLLCNATTGDFKSILNAKALTTKRTAATSALASTYLSKENSNSLLVIGSGALAPELIQAHTSVRPIKEVYVWGRSLEKAQQVCNSFRDSHFSITPISQIEDKISAVDIISCATLSETPLVFGKYLQPGQHVDLVGAYRSTMRESDDEAIKKASIYIDHDGAKHEAGDLAIPLQNGLIQESDIHADLFQLCSGVKTGRENNSTITLFKSVGHALEDLVAAQLVVKHYKI